MLIMTYLRLWVAVALSVCALVAALWLVYHGEYGRAFGTFFLVAGLGILVSPDADDLAAWDQFVKDQRP